MSTSSSMRWELRAILNVVGDRASRTMLENTFAGARCPNPCRQPSTEKKPLYSAGEEICILHCTDYPRSAVWRPYSWREAQGKPHNQLRGQGQDAKNGRMIHHRAQATNERIIIHQIPPIDIPCIVAHTLQHIRRKQAPHTRALNISKLTDIIQEYANVSTSARSNLGNFRCDGAKVRRIASAN